MKTYILTVRESYGEYVYAIFANSFEEAYEKIQTDETLSLSYFRDYNEEPKFVLFVADTEESYPCECTIRELQESDEIIYLGGYD